MSRERTACRVSVERLRGTRARVPYTLACPLKTNKTNKQDKQNKQTITKTLLVTDHAKIARETERQAREVNHISDFSHCIHALVNFNLAANLYMPSQRYVTISLDIKKRKLHDDSSYS